MNCYICGKDFSVIQRPDSEECHCPDCGAYRISGTALKFYREKNWKFDVNLVRQWLASNQSSDQITLIDSDRAELLIVR